MYLLFLIRYINKYIKITINPIIVLRVLPNKRHVINNEINTKSITLYTIFLLSMNKPIEYERHSNIKVPKKLGFVIKPFAHGCPLL